MVEIATILALQPLAQRASPPAPGAAGDVFAQTLAEFLDKAGSVAEGAPTPPTPGISAPGLSSDRQDDAADGSDLPPETGEPAVRSDAWLVAAVPALPLDPTPLPTITEPGQPVAATIPAALPASAPPPAIAPAKGLDDSAPTDATGRALPQPNTPQPQLSPDFKATNGGPVHNFGLDAATAASVAPTNARTDAGVVQTPVPSSSPALRGYTDAGVDAAPASAPPFNPAPAPTAADAAPPSAPPSTLAPAGLTDAGYNVSRTAVVLPPTPVNSPSAAVNSASAPKITSPAITNQPGSADATSQNRAPIAAIPARAGPVLPQPIVQPAARAFAAAIAAAIRPRQPNSRDNPITTVFSSAIESAAVDRSGIQSTADARAPALDLRQERGLQGVIDRIELLRDDANARDTRIRLVPDALGGVEIAVRKEGNALHVHFTAENRATATLLSEAQPRLAELAEARGVRLGQTSVSAGTSDGQASRQQRQPAVPQQTVPPRARQGKGAPQHDHQIA